jgi:F0F1-type ATP synthase assembly protein I
MWEFIGILGLVGFVAGVIAVIALFAQRDANKQKEKAAGQKEGEHSGTA